ATGTLPFPGEDWYAIMRQHVEDPPQPPRALNPAISEAADAAILRCLAKAPEDRFQTAAELAASLAAVAHPSAMFGLTSPSAGATIDLAVRSRPSGVKPLPARRSWRRAGAALGVVA